MGVIQGIVGSYAGSSLNPAAAAFLTATGITDPTITSAIDTLVNDLQGYGLWDLDDAIYPYVGGTADTHKYNLKDPQDTDAAFRITWNGTITHNANGVTGGGGASDYGNTHITPATHLTPNDTHLSVYCRTAAASANPDMGCIATNRINIAARIGSDAITEQYALFISTATPDGQGLFIATRRANNSLELYRNGASLATNTSTDSGALPNTEMRVCGSTGQGGSNHNLAWSAAGAAFSDTQAANYYTAIQAFQTTLGRQV